MAGRHTDLNWSLQIPAINMAHRARLHVSTGPSGLFECRTQTSSWTCPISAQPLAPLTLLFCQQAGATGCGTATMPSSSQPTRDGTLSPSVTASSSAPRITRSAPSGLWPACYGCSKMTRLPRREDFRGEQIPIVSRVNTGRHRSALVEQLSALTQRSLPEARTVRVK